MASTATNTSATPTPEPQKSVAQQRREVMKSTSSDLRNQVTVEDTVDFQLLSNTPAEMIAAMTGWTLAELDERAKVLEVTLKGSLAGDFSSKI